MGELTKRVAQNAAYQIAGKVLSVFLGALAFSFMARYLGQDGFGDYTTITTFAVFFSTMADMGFYFIAVREISKPTENENVIFSNAFTLRLIASIFFVLLAPIVGLFFDYSLAVKIGILVAGFSTLFVSINQILVAIFQKHLRTDQVAMTEVVSRIAFVGMIAALIHFQAGIMAFVWAMGLSSLLNFVLLYASSRKFLRFHLTFDRVIWRNILKHAWPIGIVIIVNLFYFRFNVVLLSLMKPSSDVGIFGAAYKIIEILAALPAIFVGLVIPILSRYLVESQEKFRDVFRRSFDVLILVAVPIAVGTQFVAHWVIDLVGGEEFASSARVLQILIIAVLAMFLSSLATNTVIVLNRQRTMIGVSIAAALLSIAMNLVLIPRFSYIGTAWTTVATEMLIAILTFFIVFRAMKLRPRFSVLWKVLLAGALMGGVLWVLGSDSAILNILVGGVVYAGVVFGLRAFRIQDVQSIVQFSRRSK